MSKASRPKGWGAAEIWLSLRTADRAKAKEECARVTAVVERTKAVLRAAPPGLSFKQIQALTGEGYTALVKLLADNPGDPEVYASLRRSLANEEAVGIASGCLRQLFLEQGSRIAVGTGYSVTEENVDALVSSIMRGLDHSASVLERHAKGDYSPDPNANRYPVWETQGVTFSVLLDGWQKERTPRKATVETYRTHLKELAAFLKHDDASGVTADDMQRWKEHLLASGRLKAKTINEKHLAAVKAVLGWAKANRKLAINPAQGVAVKAKGTPRGRSKGFSDEEAVTILKAARGAATMEQALANRRLAARRWIPWLCCYSGARVAELAQMRREDVTQEQGVPLVVLTPEAGSIKSDIFRKVPLHRDLVEQGFLEFVGRAGPGPLFYSPARRRKVDPRKPPAQTVANKLAAWVRSVGVTDPRVAPSHSWRHRFATECRRHGVSEGAEMALKGHTPGTEGAKYGDWPPDVLAKELAKLPKVKV